MRGFFVLVSIGVTAAACTSSDDSAATRTSTSSVGVPGENSIHGGMPCHCDHDDYVCPRARRGFGISPVPIGTRGRSCDEIVQVSYGHMDPDPTVGNECVGRACSVDAECDTCQTCGAGVCVAPAPDSACLQSGG